MTPGYIILCLGALIYGSFVEPFRVTSIKNDDANVYTAAVYEHPVIFPAKNAESYDEAVQQMMQNLNEYKKQADIAGSQGVDIIVFPEDGIYSYRFNDPTEIEPYLEYIPDPAEINWTPCIDPGRFNRTKVQTFLSCLAMNNSFYLVANYGDAQPCTPQDPNCPANGQYQYNTNIVFNRMGKLIARYHKQNLFFETQFQEPVHPEMVFFDTEFGRFGTFTCFDILFHDPSIPLLEKYNITDVAFPTAWIDTLPFFSAIGYHSSFAAAYNVNFLAANVHHPLFRFQGSGIYTPDGAISFYYDRTSSNGQLLIGDVPIQKRKINRQNQLLIGEVPIPKRKINRQNQLLIGDVPIQKRKINRQNEISFTFGATELQFLKEHDFKARVFHDWYNFVGLSSKDGNTTVCQEGHCCFLSYERDQVIGNYAFGVFNGIHRQNGTYYLQVCILLKCTSEDNQSCGQLTFTADGYFNSFNIRGNFSTPYVTPQVITSNNGSLELPALNSMKYDTFGLIGNAMTTPLLETALIGRVYESD